ncbi:hypothetical protein PV328_001090 [Microctonus aethiopoides]|uniref:Uncharacterized protein n=1 Tax=Microctonus aethiopoides TaxID=144406 RepID=A0AA39KX48_9HYME|nr:hypothetical protein PV328_001090 [Microctonus aethiopoides]
MQKNFKKKCTYDGNDHDHSVDNSGNQDNLEDETQEAGKKIKKFDFPIDAKDNFDDFNIQLNTESYYRKQVKRMCQIINKSGTVNKNVTAIIKAYISRNVATLYVPSKSPMGNQSKPVFKNTHFYECIEDAMRKNLKNSLGNDLTDKNILNSMASTIRNARD